MKKFFYTVPAAIMAYMLSVVGYAEGNITVGRVEIVDYVMFIGLGIFLVGMIMVLLAVFVGGNKKEADEYETVDEYDEYDEYEEYEEDTEEDTEDVIEESQEEDYENTLPEDEETEEEVIEDVVAEEVAEEEPVVYEEEVENKVRLTFSGVNNSDFKIVEFADAITVGRKTFNDIVIEDKAVSGKHCEITYEDGAVFITDLDSTNGTFVNDEPVVRCEIESGDAIIIGKNKYKINISM